MVGFAQLRDRNFSHVVISCVAGAAVSLGPSCAVLLAQGSASAGEPRLYAPMYRGDFDAVGSGEAAVLDFLAMLAGFGQRQCPSEPWEVGPGERLPTEEEYMGAMNRIYQSSPGIMLASLGFPRNPHFQAAAPWVARHGCNSREVATMMENLLRFTIWLDARL